MNPIKAMKEFLEEQLRRNNAPDTLEFYRENLAAFFAWMECSQGIVHLDIDISVVYDWLGYLRGRDNNDASIGARWRALRAFFNWCAAEGYCRNIFAGRKTPKIAQKVIDILSVDEMAVLLADTSEHVHLIVLLMLDCGLRFSEVLRLYKSQVKDGYMIVTGKGAKQRIVPMSTYTSMYILAFLGGTDGPVVLLTQNGLKSVFRRLKKKTGIERLHPHLLRHTFATYYIINGGDPISLQAILGHTSQVMTQRYVHLAASHLAVKQRIYSPLAQMVLD